MRLAALSIPTVTAFLVILVILIVLVRHRPVVRTRQTVGRAALQILGSR